LRIFDRLFEYLSWSNERLLSRLNSEGHHERRAALVCLLTAACAASNVSTVIGYKDAGWFWLPPITLWSTWAQDGLDDAITAARLTGLDVELATKQGT